MGVEDGREHTKHIPGFFEDVRRVAMGKGFGQFDGFFEVFFVQVFGLRTVPQLAPQERNTYLEGQCFFPLMYLPILRDKTMLLTLEYTFRVPFPFPLSDPRKNRSTLSPPLELRGLLGEQPAKTLLHGFRTWLFHQNGFGRSGASPNRTFKRL